MIIDLTSSCSSL
ncbi:hypothetical protein RDI58_027348 [Solanum bulbocastanum]|uniref:Uncharacterized protein n=1 Tax=Solanum bulbocastanum TaxID=147425 RepID=A0AAN8SY20_SOLBU